MPIPSNEALARLREGNARFATDSPERVTAANPAFRETLTSGQAPFAVVVGCADSRVPVETVFDQAAGDLFVIRVAGNVAGPSQVGSAEFAVGMLGCKLIVVLGHTGCGAVAAALDPSRADALPASLGALVAGIRNGVAGIDTPEEAVRQNVRNAVRGFAASSELLGDAVARGDLVVAGAIYQLETGTVHFLVD